MSEPCKPEAALTTMLVFPPWNAPMITSSSGTVTAAGPVVPTHLPAHAPPGALALLSVSNAAATALAATLGPPLSPAPQPLAPTPPGSSTPPALEESEGHRSRPSTSCCALARGLFAWVQARLERQFQRSLHGPYENALLIPEHTDRNQVQRLAGDLATTWATLDSDAIDRVQLSTHQVMSRAEDFFPALEVQALREATRFFNHDFDGHYYQHVFINADNGHVTAYGSDAFHTLLTGTPATADWAREDMAMWSYAQRTGAPDADPVTAAEALSSFPLLLALHADRFPAHVAGR